MRFCILYLEKISKKVSDMCIRKLQSTRSGSFFITLPKAWVLDKELEKGWELTVSFDEDGDLKVSPLGSQKKYYSEFIIQIEDYPEEHSLERSIQSYYIQGSDVISILSKKTITLEKNISPLVLMTCRFIFLMSSSVKLPISILPQATVSSL